ncbi:MAG: V4R domain-containing protein [Candidatus Jordarchaeaceae archaeon]
MALASTGIAELDKLLGGGVPRGSTVLILCEGQNAQEASALLGIICLNILERGENVILLTTDPPNETFPQLYAPEIAASALRENRLFYIDLFSSSMGVQSSENSNIVVVEKPHDLNHVFYHVSMFRDDKLKGIPAPGLKVSWIYNQLSTTIFTVGDPDKVLRFIWNFRSKIKTLRDVAYTVMNVEMHPKQVVETAKHIFDTVIELRTTEKDGISIKHIRILKNAGLPCVTDLVTYSVDIQSRKFLLSSEIVTSFEEFRKMLTMDIPGVLRLPLYDAFARFLVMPANQILNIIKKAGEDNLLEKVKDFLDYAGYENGRALAQIFKEKYKLQGDKIAESCLTTGTIVGWGNFSLMAEGDKLKVIVRIKNSPFINSLRKLKQPICFIQRGFIRGVLDVAYGFHYYVEETKCLGLGDEECEFIATKGSVSGSLPKMSDLESLELLAPLISATKVKLEEFKENAIRKNKEIFRGTNLTFQKIPEKMPQLILSCLGLEATLLKQEEEAITYQISNCPYQNKEKTFHNICTAYLEALLEAMGVKTKIRASEPSLTENKCVLTITKA